MRRNLINLALVFGLLILVTACFCRSDRTSDGPLILSENEEQSNSTSGPAPSTGKKADKGDFVVEHTEVAAPRYVEIDRQVKSEKLLEKAANQLNRNLILPGDITLRTKDCSEKNAFYDGNDRSVTMCYELMEHFYSAFRSAGDSQQDAYQKMFDAVRFVFLHEIGHALIDVYELPVVGNEEDAADRMAAYVNLVELGDDGVRAVSAAAEAFAIESKQNAGAHRNMADEHLLQEQRFYNSLCMIYGSNPGKYSRLVSEGFLPQERAVRCPGEYQRAVTSWVNLLEPWRKI